MQMQYFVTAEQQTLSNKVKFEIGLHDPLKLIVLM